MLCHAENFVDGLLPGGEDEGARVDDDDVGVLRFGCDLKAPLGQDGGHDLGIHLILGAAEADDMNAAGGHLGYFLTRTFLGLTPSEGPTTPSVSMRSMMRAARLYPIFM